MKRCRLKRSNFQIRNKMNKENQTSDKQQNGNDFIADVSKSFAVGKRVVIIGCEKGHMFKVGEKVTIVEKECDMWWAVNRHDEHWLINENEANVC
jgi:hypothetical protein